MQPQPLLVSLDIPHVLDGLHCRYPAFLVDAVVEHDPGRRMAAVKNVTVNEEYFQGHFPGMPLMPGVMMIESLLQVATLLLRTDQDSGTSRAFLRGVNHAKFRRQVVPGDRIKLDVVLRRRRTGLAVVRGEAKVGTQIVAEAELLVGIEADAVEIHPSAIVHPSAVVGAGSVVEPHAVIGAQVRIGRNCRVGASAVIDGDTEIGDASKVYPFASIGLIPQDLKFKGESTRLVIGRRNVFREFVTVHRGTRGGGGVTSVGNDNVFMAYAHVAHDCRIGDRTIFGNGATLGGHVVVEDEATISAYSGVHQFCRVGRKAFIGGYSVVTKDALPYGKTVGNRARIYGLNTIGLVRRGSSQGTIARLKRAYRYLLQSKLNTTRAVRRIMDDPDVACPEVEYLVEFIRTSKRGVNLRRPSRRVEPVDVDE
ncbi:MAG: acyl-ACP--UDP-N-acetylglucosamine O-acyltransferase [Acidobacteria bacterium]|nr:acyl-ACP--UDP-N-acetylglucosamine O-acyltransferase [Acidobacteriota bacterium]